ncbi:MAG: methyltransferase domain-containing protein [Acidimicrobiales bacterium]
MSPADRYTHGHHDSVLRSHRWRTAENSAGFLLDHLRPGQRVIDVGCGPGTITAGLARRVAPGAVVGIDREESVVSAARAAHAGTDNLSFEVGDAYQLELLDESADVVYLHQVLQHLSDPVAALVEARRVLRVGGLVAVRDADYGEFVWAPRDARLDRWLSLYHEVTAGLGGDADAGRRLPDWVRAAGFDDLVVSASTWTFATADERRWWGQLWAERVVASDFATHALAARLTTREELGSIAQGFRDWVETEGGHFVVVHVEVVARRWR